MLLERLSQALPHGRSMKRFVLVWSAVFLTLLSAIDGLFTFLPASRTVAVGLDRTLTRIATAHAAIARNSGTSSDRLVDAEVFPLELNLGNGLRYRIDSNRAFLDGDRDLPPPTGSIAEQVVAKDFLLNGQAMRVVSVTSAHTPKDGLMTVQAAAPLSLLWDVQGNLLRNALFSAAVRLLGVLLVIRLGVYLAFRPLEKLRSDLARRLPTDHSPADAHGQEELIPLVQTLNKLLLAQDDAFSRQRQFLADASHQLRTPIAVLRTQIQGMASGEMLAGETLPKMLRTVDRATGLASQLLSMAKVEQLVRRGEWTSVSLDGVARQVAMEFAPLIARKKIDFTLDAENCVVMTDSWLVGELIRNLLANAIHHSRPRGSVGIILRISRSELELIVWDHGEGIETEVLERLFEPFVAAKGGTGIGLGLSICRQIAESIGASIELFNRVDSGIVVGVDAVVRWPRSVLAAIEAFDRSDEPNRESH